ncbi:MAG: hypothetical protein ACMG6S_00275 [Byssovorax sp.]
MSARGARVIDLEEYRRKRQARSAQPTPAPAMVWYAVPMWFWVPVWTTR